MKTYSIPVPSLEGVLSDDYLYFEGTRRPSVFFDLRDSKDHRKISKNSIVILERYLSDIYNLFLRKITTFISTECVDDEESLKLQALLQELIKVRKIIENTSKVDIME